MKITVLITMVFSLLFVTNVEAQKNENVKKETTVKKVTVKDTNTETVVDKEVKETKSKLKVKGSKETNQDADEVIVKDQKIKTVEVIEKDENLKNKAAIEKAKLEKGERVDGKQRGKPLKVSDSKNVNTKNDDGGGK
ncbi:hypothetical protein [uncultured Planktosalinus sp.]|uniref:hypothetical protein n=1 Tax=uncultured Planktosalinus sp. TaxID=1810935 RepID=UPI0030DB6217